MKMKDETLHTTEADDEPSVSELRIVDQESDSDDEDTKKRAMSLVSTSGVLQQPSQPHVYGSVSVENSDNVHFGNNTYFNGPVTIKQIIRSRSGFDNPSFTKADIDVAGKSEEKKPTTEKSKIQIKRWQLNVCIAGTVIIFAVITFIVIWMKKDDQQMDSPSNSNDTFVSSAGLRIVSRTDWLAQPIEDKLTPLRLPAPWAIITHTATESCLSQSKCVLRVRLMQTFHIESKGWSDIGYNFLIGGDGSVYSGRGWDFEGAHTLGYNRFSIGIAFIGTFNTEPPNDKQLLACKRLLEEGVKLGKLKENYKLVAHRQLMSTLSPGDKTVEIIKTWPHFVTDLNDLANPQLG